MYAHLRSEEVDVTEFHRRAPRIEPSSFLLTRSKICPVGRKVVFIKDGYLQQCKDIGAPLEEPCWTSLLARRQQQLRHSNLRCARALGAPGQHKLGLVEVCKVVDATFHHRLPGPAPERPAPAAAQPPAVADLPADGSSEGQPERSAGAARPAPQAAAGSAVPSEAPAGGQSAAAAPAAAAADAPAGAAHEGGSPGHAARAGSGSPAPERDGTGGAASPDDSGVDVPVRGQRAAWFVRITLQQLRLRGSRASASSLWTTIDFFVDADVPDWLISLDRYNAAHRRAWRPGDRFRMLWEFPDQPDLRVWYFGAVLQRVPRKRADPRRDSPWEALQVAWDTGEVTCVSCWEIERHHERSSPAHSLSPDEEMWEEDWVSNGEHSDGESDLEEFCDLDEGERAGRNITGRRRRRPAGYASSRERARPR